MIKLRKDYNFMRPLSASAYIKLRNVEKEKARTEIGMGVLFAACCFVMLYCLLFGAW